MRGGVSGGTKKAELEAFQTARAALGHVGDADDRLCGRSCWLSGLRGGFRVPGDLQSAHKGQPISVIIFIINRFEAVSGGIANQLVAANLIFPERNDVGVAEEYSRAQAGSDHPFDDGGRAGRAAAMQQDALLRKVAPFRRLWDESLLMNIPVRHSTTNLRFAAKFTAPRFTRTNITIFLEKRNF